MWDLRRWLGWRIILSSAQDGSRRGPLDLADQWARLMRHVFFVDGAAHA